LTTPLTRAVLSPRFLLPLAAVLVAGLAGRARAGAGHDHAPHGHASAAHAAHAPARLEDARHVLRSAREALPPPPSGVTDLDFGELFGPIGARGLEYSPKARALDGKRVRMLGYMVSQDAPVAGMLLLAPFPFQLHETEYGLAEDLPATLVHVRVPDRADAVVPHTPGLLLLTGELSLEPREEPDGRISNVRLRLEPRASRPLPAAPTQKKEKKR
jgi:hypothetical protein